MKVKTSITISDDLLREIDGCSADFGSRSSFLEAAARGLLRELARREVEGGDLDIIDRRADALNDEAEDVLAYQVVL